MDIIAYKIPQGEGHPNISGMEQLRYAENYYICSVPDVNLIQVGLLQKYNIVKSNEQVVRGLEFFIATQDSAKIYKTYSSGQSAEFFDEEFSTVNGVRVKRPMTDEEVTDRYEAIRWIRKQMVRDYYKQKFQTLVENKTPQERATWTLQEQEAKAYSIDNTALTPTLSALATARGIEVSEIVTNVLNAVSAYNTLVTNIFADEENYINQLNSATGDDIINVRLPINTTIIPGDTRFDGQSSGE